MARLVSKVYGEALFEFAKESDQLEKMFEEALDIIEVFTSSEEVNDFLNNPNVNKDQKISFLHTVFVDKFWAGPVAKIFKFFHIDIHKGQNPKILEFLSIVIRKGRQKDIVPILRHFTHLVLLSLNIGEASVTSAEELSDKQKKDLEKKLVDTTRFDNFVVSYNVDESLIAGIKIKIDDKVLDTSYRTKIDSISKNLRGLKL